MLSVVLVCVAVCALAIAIGWKKSGAQHPLPPATTGALPLIGHTHYFIGDTENLWKKVQIFAEDCLQQGGVTVLYLGTDLYYIITDPEDAYTASNACLTKHFAYSFAKPWLGNGLVTGSGDIWKKHRKLLSPAFSVPVVNGFIDIFNSQARRLVRLMDQHAGTKPFDHSDMLKKMSLETICLTAFGTDVEKDFVINYMDAVDEIMHLVTFRSYTVYLHSDIVYKISGLKKKEDDLIRYLSDMSNNIINKKKEIMKNKIIINGETESKTGRSKPLIELLLELSFSNTLNDQEIKEEVDTTIVAAFDTTSNVLCYIILLLGAHPAVQEIMYQEIMEVIGKERDVEKDDISKLSYTEAVIKESMRYMPVVPLLLRYVDTDCKLKKYTMRAGSQCILVPTGTHRHESWGPERACFKPERWLDASTLPADTNTFAGFSIGKRNCIGRTYAMALMKVTLAHLVRSYRISASLTDLNLKLDFLLKPASGCEISLENRD